MGGAARKWLTDKATPAVPGRFQPEQRQKHSQPAPHPFPRSLTGKQGHSQALPEPSHLALEQ